MTRVSTYIFALIALAACAGEKRAAPQDSAAPTSSAGAAAAPTVANTPGTATREVPAAPVTPGPLSATPSSPPGVTGAALVDGQIANELLTTNSVDSIAGALAAGRAASAAVKAFAQTMVRDHGAANRRTITLVQRLQLAPSETQEGRALMAGTEQSIGAMQSASGAAFDRAYMDGQVQFHQSALDALDQRLLPRASAPELRALLQQQRTSVAAHLARAKEVRGQLGG